MTSLYATRRCAASARDSRIRVASRRPGTPPLRRGSCVSSRLCRCGVLFSPARVGAADVVVPRLNARSSESLDSAEAKRKEIKIESNRADQVIDVVEDVDTAPSAAGLARSMRSQPTPVSVPHDSRGRACRPNAGARRALLAPSACGCSPRPRSTASAARTTRRRTEAICASSRSIPAWRAVFERLAPFASARLVHDGREWCRSGNECWRSPSTAGDRFERHFDAAFVRGADERSMFTVNIYMNSAGDGGDQRRRDALRRRDAPPRRGGRRDRARGGQCVVFRQPPALTSTTMAKSSRRVRSTSSVPTSCIGPSPTSTTPAPTRRSRRFSREVGPHLASSRTTYIPTATSFRSTHSGPAASSNCNAADPAACAPPSSWPSSHNTANSGPLRWCRRR